MTRHLFTCNLPLSSPYPSAFPSFLCTSPWSLPVPTVDSSLRHLGLAQSQNALSLHLTVPHAPKLWPVSGCGVTQIASPMDLWWWVSPKVPKVEGLRLRGFWLIPVSPRGYLDSPRCRDSPRLPVWYRWDSFSDGLGRMRMRGDLGPTHP